MLVDGSKDTRIQGLLCTTTCHSLQIEDTAHRQLAHLVRPDRWRDIFPFSCESFYTGRPFQHQRYRQQLERHPAPTIEPTRTAAAIRMASLDNAIFDLECWCDARTILPRYEECLAAHNCHFFHRFRPDIRAWNDRSKPDLSGDRCTNSRHTLPEAIQNRDKLNAKLVPDYGTSRLSRLRLS